MEEEIKENTIEEERVEEKTNEVIDEVLEWKTEKRKIKDLKLFEGNPRKMTEKQAERLLESLKKFNYVELIAIDQNNRVIAGNMRVQALKRLGREDEEIEVRVPSRPLTEEEAREYLLRSNKNIGEWDWDLLANFSEEELRRVGFDREELDKIIEVKEDDFDVVEEYEKIENPVVKIGDLFRLGNHRLLCGDSTDFKNFGILLGEERAQLVYTDPPYNVNYKYDVLHKGKKVKNKIQSFKDSWTPEEYKNLIYKVFKNAYDFSKDNAVFYCWHATKTEMDVRRGLEEAGWYVSQTLIWLKENIVLALGQDYQRIYEPCYFGWKRGKKRFSNKKFTSKFREAFSLNFNDFTDWLDALYERRDKISEYIHPTQKPVRLAERMIKKHSSEGDIVLEMFNGSGSTMMACEQLNRHCYGIELDPRFVEVAIKRWEQLTGQKAIKLN